MSLHNTTTTPVIRPMFESDRERVEALWRSHYYGPHEGWLDSATDDTSSVEGFVAQAAGKAVGFGIVGVGPIEWAEEEYDVALAPHVDTDSVGWLRQILVTPAYRSNGIATKLTAARLWWLFNHDEQPSHAAAVCWVREEGPDARGILQRLGFERTEYEENAYETTECPDCEGECTCDAAVYVGNVRDALREVVG